MTPTKAQSEIGRFLEAEGKGLSLEGGYDRGDQGALWSPRGWGVGWSTDQDDGTIRLSVLDAESGLPLHDESERGEAEDFEAIAAVYSHLHWVTRAAREEIERRTAARDVEAQASREADHSRI